MSLKGTVAAKSLPISVQVCVTSERNSGSTHPNRSMRKTVISLGLPHHSMVSEYWEFPVTERNGRSFGRYKWEQVVTLRDTLNVNKALKGIN